MKLPWTGSRIALIAAAGESRRFNFFVLLTATIGTVAFSFLNPQIIRFTIDSVIGTAPLDAPAFVVRLVDALGGTLALRYSIWICAIFIVAAALLSELCNMARQYTAMELGETVAWNLRNHLYAHIQRLPWDWHIGCQTGDIIQRCTTDVDRIRTFIQNRLHEFFRICSIFIIALVIMFSMDFFMSIISLVMIPAVGVFSIIYFRQVTKEYARADEAEGVMQAAAQENYTGVRVVRAFGREVWEIDRFNEKSEAYTNIWFRIGRMLGIFWGAGDILTGLQLAIVVVVGVWRTVHGELSPGTFLAFYAYCNFMIWPVRQLGRILSEISQTLVAADRARDILAAEPESDPPDALCPEIRGEIRFERVSFSYNTGEPVLKDISFTLKPGETLAILGATGSGKTSLVHLLSRLYDLPEGNGIITLDGIDIRRIARHHLRRHIGLCLQEPFLFSKTIRENISAAKNGLEMHELREVAAVAMVDETIESFTDGYQTIIGERGVTLSGGQMQRVSIARMLAANTPVMIFDDSLSAVDTETDAKIRAALRHRVKDAAVIIISHRISSLMQADKILVLKDGQVEALGSHAELVERDGSYRRIFELQAAGTNGEG